MGENCKHCGKPLKKSQFTPDGRKKSCPKCSREDGEEHIFYPYPDDFGQSEKRTASGRPDGPQSWCSLCRSNDFGPHPGGKRCSEVI